MEESDVKRWLVAAQEEQWDVHESLRPRIFAWVYRMSLKILRREADSEDAAAETLTRIYIKRDVYDQTKSAKTWIASITMRLCIDMLRRKNPEVVAPDDSRIRDWAEPAWILEELILKELLAALIGCLGKLTDLEAAAVLATAFDQPLDGISDKSRHQGTYKARVKLRKCLKKAGHEFPESRKK